jgi:hypothetical protein
MSAERPGHGELPKAVSDHVFRNKDRYMAPSVMHTERHSNHVGENRRPARPGLDNRFFPGARDGVYFFSEFRVNGWPFFN